jgi:hypothetical protein
MEFGSDDDTSRMGLIAEYINGGGRKFAYFIAEYIYQIALCAICAVGIFIILVYLEYLFLCIVYHFGYMKEHGENRFVSRL